MRSRNLALNAASIGFYPAALSLVHILLYSRRRLLACPDLREKCSLAAGARATFAIVCLAAFFGMVVIILGFQAFPFSWVPVLMGGAFAIFLFSTLLAYRLGRLCNAEIGPSRRNAIVHLRMKNRAADAYYEGVITQGRPFTRLDLDELQSISRSSPQAEPR